MIVTVKENCKPIPPQIQEFINLCYERKADFRTYAHELGQFIKDDYISNIWDSPEERVKPFIVVCKDGETLRYSWGISFTFARREELETIIINNSKYDDVDVEVFTFPEGKRIEFEIEKKVIFK